MLLTPNCNLNNCAYQILLTKSSPGGPPDPTDPGGRRRALTTHPSSRHMVPM